MTLEWLRRRDPVMDRHLRTYLFTDGSVIGIESEAEHGGGGEPVTHPDTRRDGRREHHRGGAGEYRQCPAQGTGRQPQHPTHVS